MNDEVRAQWGTNIRILRKARGMTLRQLADKVDVTEATVSRWECGKAGIRDDHKVRVAEALHADVRILFPLVRGAA